MKLNELLKNKHIFRLCIILFIGAVLLVVSHGSNGKQKDINTQSVMPTQFSGEDTEKRLGKILSRIRGVGDVHVMLTYDGTGKRSYIKEVNREQSRDGEKTSTAESTAVVTAKDTPVLESEIYPAVRGVIVVAQGAESASVREQIVLALKAVLEVEEHRIGVFAK